MGGVSFEERLIIITNFPSSSFHFDLVVSIVGQFILLLIDFLSVHRSFDLERGVFLVLGFAGCVDPSTTSRDTYRPIRLPTSSGGSNTKKTAPFPFLLVRRCLPLLQTVSLDCSLDILIRAAWTRPTFCGSRNYRNVSPTFCGMVTKTHRPCPLMKIDEDDWWCINYHVYPAFAEGYWFRIPMGILASGLDQPSGHASPIIVCWLPWWPSLSNLIIVSLPAPNYHCLSRLFILLLSYHYHHPDHFTS